MIDEKTKMALFERVLHFEHATEKGIIHNGRNYFELLNGAFEMLEILGLDGEYTRWSEGR